jgi:hypothetical protein
MKAITVTAFDYSTLDKDVAGKLQSLAVQVRRGSMKVGEGGMEVGEAVFEAHKLLAGNGREGKFKAWVQDNGLSVSSAYECMYVYERSRKHPRLLEFPPSVQYLLAAPNTPVSAINEAQKRLDRGEKPTVAWARQITGKSAPKKLPNLSEASAQAIDAIGVATPDAQNGTSVPPCDSQLASPNNAPKTDDEGSIDHVAESEPAAAVQDVEQPAEAGDDTTVVVVAVRPGKKPKNGAEKNAVDRDIEKGFVDLIKLIDKRTGGESEHRYAAIKHLQQAYDAWQDMQKEGAA